VEETTSVQASAFERREHVLQVYYKRLNNMDRSNRELTSFFFGINTALLALVLEVVKNDLQRLILALVGYCVSLAIYLITYKSFLAWRLYALDMGRIEDELDYDISKKYEARLTNTPGTSIRITLVRLRFNFLFILLWLGIAGYLLYTLSTTYYLRPLWLNVPGFLFLMAMITYVPWAYFAGSGRLALLWNTLRALWAREV
jgi:hypothetical protein